MPAPQKREPVPQKFFVAPAEHCSQVSPRARILA